MRIPLPWSVLAFPLAAALAGCAPTVGDEVPITTASDEARQLYVEGRDLYEKLRAAEAREKFVQAVEKDPDFAIAHLALANSSATAQEFFVHLEKAGSASENASEGERLLVRATYAGVQGEPEEQRVAYEKLVELFPYDERAHTVLGNWHFARQEYDEAIDHYEQAVAIDPEYAGSYNQLGYSYRFKEDFPRAEEAFKKYIELIPNEPNPYDSYAEFLMKVGRFRESIDNYEKALVANESFTPSFVGIANNQIFLGETDAARETLARLMARARNDGEKRQAYFWTAASHVHDGRYKAAIQAIESSMAVAAAIDDRSAMAGDLIQMGNILLDSDRPNEALAKFDAGLAMALEATTPDGTKNAARRNHHYNVARVALLNGDLAVAKEKAAVYRKLVSEKNIPFEVRQANHLDGRIAFQEKDYEAALAALSKANQQDPKVLYLTSLACKAKGDHAGAHAACDKAANYNALNFNYAFVRGDAQDLLGELVVN